MGAYIVPVAKQGTCGDRGVSRGGLSRRGGPLQQPVPACLLDSSVLLFVLPPFPGFQHIIRLHISPVTFAARATTSELHP